LRKFHIVSTDPPVSRVSNSIPFFNINFNKPLVSKSLKITSSPDIISSYNVSGKAIDISLKPLTVNQAYTITINSLAATDNETIQNKSLRFVAQYISPQDLPNDQKQAILHNQENYSSPADNPIVGHLPHSTLNFILSAQVTTGTNSKPSLVLQAQILLAPGVTGATAAADINQYKQDVLSYIQSLGLNPAQYNIQYQIVNETITGV